jgi:hypothetical protein
MLIKAILKNKWLVSWIFSYITKKKPYKAAKYWGKCDWASIQSVWKAKYYRLFCYLLPKTNKIISYFYCRYVLSSIFLSILIKFIYSEKTTKFCKISTVDLTYLVPVKSTAEISQHFVAFSEYMNFTNSQVIALRVSMAISQGERNYVSESEHRLYAR